MKPQAATALLLTLAAGPSASPQAVEEPHPGTTDSLMVILEALPLEVESWIDSLAVDPFADLIPTEILTLTDDDYAFVADQLGIEVPVIKAVVEIEAGPAHKGFSAPGKPLINFDLTMYRKFAPRHGVNLAKAQRSSPEIFAKPNIKAHGSQQAAQQARLDAAAAIDRLSAFESTFWGMFQIGGFNWKKCGAESLDHFVQLMSRSERDQLLLFAKFVENSGMLPYLRKKQWAQFALRYNGPNYRARNYHTRLAAAYARHRLPKK